MPRTSKDPRQTAISVASTSAEAGGPERSARSEDSGSSLVEAVLAIAITGLLVTGTLTLMQGTIFASTLQRDHANAHAWLQSASDRLYASDKVSCDPSAPNAGEAAVRAAYDATIDDVPNPGGWTNTQIRIVPPVEFWNATDTNGDSIAEFSFGSACDDGDGLSLQRIELEVVSPSGTIIETVEIVK